MIHGFFTVNSAAAGGNDLVLNMYFEDFLFFDFP